MAKVVIIDDIKSARSMLARLLSQYSQLEIVGSFSSAQMAEDFIKNNEVDLIFLDIEMPETDGITFAKKIGNTGAKPFIVFATAYSEYSLEAWNTSAIGYITKPYDKKALDDCVMRFFALTEQEQELMVKCFPNFGVFIRGQPLIFKNEKAKEIMAYLVYNKGAWVRVTEICAYVLEELDEEKAKNSFRSYMSRLKKTLDTYNISDIIEQQYGQYRVRVNKFDCDYYRYLKGEKALFLGEFLKSYSWSEPTTAIMEMSVYNK